MSVVGYDFGNESCIVAVARAGGVETVDNDYSLRGTPSYVGFGEKQRMLGVSAKNQTVTNVKNTIHGFKRLLGRKFIDPVVQAERRKVPFEIVQTESGGCGVQVQYLRNTVVFTLEQITAMLFTKLKQTAENALQMKASDCVISCPSYYTIAQRQSLLDSASMSGLNVLRVLNESSATALTYGIYKLQDLPEDDKPPRNVVFIDCGHSALQVFACAFNKGKIKMIVCTSDPFLGGRDFDEVLASYFSDDFQKNYGIDPRTNPRAYIRLLTEVDKIKKQMSANSTPLQLNIECFMDKDVAGTMKRETFEELAAPLFKKVEQVLKRCLDDSKLSTASIHSVEIVGGSSRIPAIKALIERIFGHAPSTTLNQDEAISRGCALQCAMLSPTFKVREFSLTDVQPYPIKLKFYEPGGSMGDMELFHQYNPFPSARMVSFCRKQSFEMIAYYSGEIPYPDPIIANFSIQNLKPTASGEKYKVKVKLRMNGNGILEACTATAYEKIDSVEAEEPMEIGSQSQPEDQHLPVNEDVKPDADDAILEKPEDEKKVEVNEKKDTVKKQHYRVIELSYLTSSHALPLNELNGFTELEGKMVADDRLEKDRIDVKNALEEYIYDFRGKLDTTLIEFVQEDDRTRYLETLKTQESWLYDEGAEELKNVYVQRLDELKTIVEPIKSRLREFEESPAALEKLSKAIIRVGQVIHDCKTKDPRYNHLEKSEVDKLEQETGTATEWLENIHGLFRRANKCENCPVSLREIHQNIDRFQKATNPIIKKTKPQESCSKKIEPDLNNPTKAEGADMPDGETTMEVEIE